MRRDLGGLIRETRRARGMTQRQLAAKVGVSNWSVCKVEIGDLVPSPTLLARLAEALDLERVYLMLLAGRLDDGLRGLFERHGDLARLLGDLTRLDPTPREMAAFLAAALEQVEAMQARRASPRPPRRGGIA